jgi:NAD-dependent deacetylase
MSPAQALAQLIDGAQRLVFFTGAGISTESGIPDFRSPGGIWSKQQPIQFQDFIADPQCRQESWRRKFSSDVLVGAKPNSGHRAIAQLIGAGRAHCVITQNVDNLHQLSGINEDKVIELHGNASYASCLQCGQHYALEPLRKQYEDSATIAPCEHCGGIIKTATISFGQSMPEQPMRRAQQAIDGCDLFIAIGSSLVVYPAAAFPLEARQQGAQLVIINREATDCDRHADLVINDEIGPLLSAVVATD